VSALSGAQGEIEAAERRLEEARAEFARLVREAGGGPARDPDHALDQVDLLRRAMGHDIDTLRDRATRTAARVADARSRLPAVSAGLAGVGVVTAVLRRRRRRGGGVVVPLAVLGIGAALGAAALKRRRSDEDIWLPER
jgi:hypothetical protein